MSAPPPPLPQYPNLQHPSTTPPGAAFDRLPSYGGASGSVSTAAVQPRGSGATIAVIVGVGAVLAMLVSLVVLKVGAGGKKDELGAASAPVLTARPAASEPYVVDLSVVPQTAAIEVDGAAAGAGRLTRSFARDGKKHSVRLSAAGYEPMVLEVDETRPLPPAVALRPLSPTSAATGAPHGKTGGPTTPVGPTPTGGTTKKAKTDNIDPWE